jgi:ABC-type branched-subunit amino acid transport system ATPase component
MVALLEVRDLAVGYGELTVAHDLSFEIQPGEVSLLMGPNGAGKTTTLLTIGGALPAQHGTILWNGATLEGPMHRRVRKGLAYLSDERGTISRLTGAENLRLAKGSLARSLELFPELSGHLHRRAGLLSGGQQKMLSLALALSRGPSLLLADELSLGLAPQIVERLLLAVRRAADDGAAVLLVEQHARRALDIADTVSVLVNGRQLVSGRTRAVRADVERILTGGYLAAVAGGATATPPATGPH